MSDQEQRLRKIQHFLETLEFPSQLSAKDQKHLFRQSTRYFVQNNQLYKRITGRPPLLVVFEKDKRLAIITQAHDELGHRGEQSTWQTVR
ncbi:hypothetical protein BDN67DRAFT_916932, partial [Paxillus ammoniavirescens]